MADHYKSSSSCSGDGVHRFFPDPLDFSRIITFEDSVESMYQVPDAARRHDPAFPSPSTSKRTSSATVSAKTSAVRVTFATERTVYDRTFPDAAWYQDHGDEDAVDDAYDAVGRLGRPRFKHDLVAEPSPCGPRRGVSSGACRRPRGQERLVEVREDG